MNDASDMNISANYRADLIGCLTTVDLIMDIGSIKLRGESGKVERPIALRLPAKKNTKHILIS